MVVLSVVFGSLAKLPSEGGCALSYFSFFRDAALAIFL